MGGTKRPAGHNQPPAGRPPVSKSTRRRHARGRPSLQDKAAKQQYLTPCEEKALVKYVLGLSERGYPLPVKFLRSLALVIARQRKSSSTNPTVYNDIKPPGKNWPQGSYKRHPELESRRIKALDWARHDCNIHKKITQWFTLIRKELQCPAILPKNVYNMDESGVILSVLNSLKVLVSKNDLRTYRGAGVKRTLVTAIECISADRRCLDPLIIWPAITHRSTWTTHPSPGWHFACSKTGYTDTHVNLSWMQNIFEPQTKRLAGDNPRILINDGFGTHESLELLEFCFKNNIILCRLPSHTSHKLQPCDVGVFGPLKAAYREQVETLYRGGAETVGKQHFTLLYDRARTLAFTRQNILSGWNKAGLFPFNPDRVLKDIHGPPSGNIVPQVLNANADVASQDEVICTPTTYESLVSLRTDIEKKVESPVRRRFRKLANAAEEAFADRAILRDRTELLIEQNNERKTRLSVRSTVVGSARVMSYEDIVEARRKREIKDSTEGRILCKRGAHARRTRARPEKACSKEIEDGKQEIQASGLEQYCSILQF